MTDFTPLSALRGGTGIDTTGFNISNGVTTKATISCHRTTTVQDLINAVNSAGVVGTDQCRGTGIDLYNTSQGTPLTFRKSVEQPPPSWASAPSARTLRCRANNGGTVFQRTGGEQFSITTADGSVIDISLTNVNTVQDVLNQIDPAAAAGKVTASSPPTAMESC